MKELIPLPIRRALGGRWDRWRAARAKARLLAALRGDAVECNVCGWRGRAFADDDWHPGTVCPSCGSQVRHRMLAAILDGVPGLEEFSENSLIAGRDVLHFAPERQLRERIRARAGRYVTADFDRGDCDLRLDLSAMPEVAEGSFDVLISCDVLEHVPSDARAFAEIFRVLRPGGTAILTVPQKDPPSATDEDASVTDPRERERRFGQKDHVRMFGCDFAARAESAGLAVTTVAAFPPETLARHVLAPPEPSPRPLATNHRRIYFARRSG